MNANQKTRLLQRGVALAAIALVAAPWWSTTARGQTSPSGDGLGWNDYPVKGLFESNLQQIADLVSGAGNSAQSNEGAGFNNGNTSNGGGGNCPNGGQLPPSNNGNHTPGGGIGLPPWLPCPPNKPPTLTPPPNFCPPGYQGEIPGGGKPPHNCPPPGNGKPPYGKPKPPGYGAPPYGQQQTPPPPKPPLPPGCQWDKPGSGKPGGGKPGNNGQTDVIISWVGQIQVNGQTLRVEFKKSGNVWIESWNGVPLFQHQELSFTGGIAVLYDAVRQIHVQLNSNTAAFSGPTGSGQLTGGFQAIG